MLLLAVLFLLNPAFAQTLEQLGPYGTNSNKINDANRWVAVVGDSGVTGAITGDGIEATLPSLKNLFGDFFSSQRFTASKIVPDSPTRVFYSRSEFTSEPWYKKIVTNFAAKVALRFDSPENSFAYKVGKAWGVRGSDIVLVGQDGARVSDIPWQLSRIFEMRPGTLPPVVLLSFTANDFCEPSVLVKPIEVTRAEFTASLSRAWADAAGQLRPHKGGTDFIVLAPLDVTALITNGSIQEKQVNMEGRGSISCMDLRMGVESSGLAAKLMDRTLGLMCPSITTTNHTESAKLTRLRQVQEVAIEVWQKQINLLNAQYNSKKINWTLIEDVRQILFTGADIANDCFHPSSSGHDKISEVILKAYPDL